MPICPKKLRTYFIRKVTFLTAIGGGITGDVQVNDKSYHPPLKAAYTNLEMQLMLDLLKKNPKKVPSSS